MCRGGELCLFFPPLIGMRLEGGVCRSDHVFFHLAFAFQVINTGNPMQKIMEDTREIEEIGVRR